MTESKIPCTVAVLTHNNEETLPRCLESVKEFTELIVCDGESTDRTLEIAAAFGARVISQDSAFKDASGRILDFASVRNQTLDTASYDWFFFLDSDEYIDADLVKEIRSIVASAEPAAYFVPRLYVVHGEIIRCASTYPNQQMRFFHRAAVRRFVKTIHERIELREGIAPAWLTFPMYVPLSDDADRLRAKWRYYLDLEDERRSRISFRAWLPFAMHETLVGVLYAFRYVRGLFSCRGARMPFRLEAARWWYQYETIRRSFRSVRLW